MPSTVFREATPAAEPTAKKPSGPVDTKVSGDTTNVEAPFTDYETVNGIPYLVEHFEIGDTWQEPVGGFPEELAIIGDYIESEIKGGKMGNDIASAKEVLKKAEKMTNMQKETRLTVKLPILAEYMKFLMEEAKIKFDALRYATN